MRTQCFNSCIPAALSHECYVLAKSLRCQGRLISIICISSTKRSCSCTLLVSSPTERISTDRKLLHVNNKICIITKHSSDCIILHILAYHHLVLCTKLLSCQVARTHIHAVCIFWNHFRNCSEVPLNSHISRRQCSFCRKNARLSQGRIVHKWIESVRDSLLNPFTCSAKIGRNDATFYSLTCLAQSIKSSSQSIKPSLFYIRAQADKILIWNFFTSFKELEFLNGVKVSLFKFQQTLKHRNVIGIYSATRNLIEFRYAAATCPCKSSTTLNRRRINLRYKGAANALFVCTCCNVVNSVYKLAILDQVSKHRHSLRTQRTSLKIHEHTHSVRSLTVLQHLLACRIEAEATIKQLNSICLRRSFECIFDFSCAKLIHANNVQVRSCDIFCKHVCLLRCLLATLLSERTGQLL